MQAIAYYLALPFLYGISLLPFPLLYLLSDVLYLLLFHVVKYRRKVVLQNLRNSFPEYSEVQIDRTMRRYYRYLCDLMLETIKNKTISRRQLQRRAPLTPETIRVLEDVAAQYPKAIMALGHIGNWEWACSSLGITRLFDTQIVYKPLSNKWFDRFMFRMRARFGTTPIPMQQTLRAMLTPSDKCRLLVLAADQTPSYSDAFWMTFLHQDTAVLSGTEKMARKLNCPVIFATIHYVKRGHYSLHAELMTTEPKALPEHQVLVDFMQRLEKEIRKAPFTWLWSHRRWKHKRSAA